jgi:hypothetical protein
MIDLYNTTDTKKVRTKLFEKQNGKCDLTGLDIEGSSIVLDHDHDTQYVRGVLHRQANAALGKIENLYVRYLKWWYPGSLQDFLRSCAEYLDKYQSVKGEYYHPGWIKKAKTMFNKLSETDKTSALRELGFTGVLNNSKARKEAFRKLLLTRKYGFDTIASVLSKFENKGET